VNSASAASQQTKVPEKGQATYAPDGIANEIAAVPTLAPQTIPTPMAVHHHQTQPDPSRRRPLQSAQLLQ